MRLLINAAGAGAPAFFLSIGHACNCSHTIRRAARHSLTAGAVEMQGIALGYLCNSRKSVYVSKFSTSFRILLVMTFINYTVAHVFVDSVPTMICFALSLVLVMMYYAYSQS